MREDEKPRAIDKSTWGEGPWQGEPDRVEFECEGFPCLITRNPVHGNLCGYVAMPPGHPWHGTWPNDVEVHGGITFASECSGDICHVPKPGQPADVWWIGFDCAHAWDRMPGMEALLTKHAPGEPKAQLTEGKAHLAGSRLHYKALPYVVLECRRLAEQARAAAAAEVRHD